MLSIIVPVLNEAAGLPALFEQLAAPMAEGCEVIVADGGSDDESAALGGRLGATVVCCARGRARQMNAGAAVARGSVLLFLHADTRLPAAAAAIIDGALDGGRRCWGRFDIAISGRPAMLRVVASMINLRSRLTGIATGDQAMFVSRAAFDAVGGFPDLDLMEDVALSARLRRLAPPVCIAERVTTSGRRWERHGVWRTIVLMWRLRWDYWRGVPASDLARRYR